MADPEYYDDVFGGIDFNATFDEEFEKNFARDFHALVPEASSVTKEKPAQQQQPIEPAAETSEPTAQFIQPHQVFVQPAPQGSIPPYNHTWLNTPEPDFASLLPTFAPALAPPLAPGLAPGLAPIVAHGLQPDIQQSSYPRAVIPSGYQPVQQLPLHALPRDSYSLGEIHFGSRSSPSASSSLPSISPRPRVSEESKFPPSPESIKTDTPRPKRPTKNHHGAPLLNDKIPRRTHRKKLADQNIEPELYYGPPPPKPKSWGPKNLKGEYLFTYTEKGELAPGKFFTTQEMRKYLMGPSPGEQWEGPARMPGARAIKGKYRQGLTLWIGWPAAMANSRYPRGGESTKCRFADCLFSQRTISVGQPWVIFDERQNKDGEVFDPFYNAGYCHLYCLESSFDIVELWQRVDIRPDNRIFKREQYEYFNLAKKLPGIEKVYQNWWHDAMEELEAIQLQKPRGRRKRTRENSLDARLVEYKLSMEGKGQAKTRQKRNGIDLSKHRGDPELKRRLQLFKKYDLLDRYGNPLPDADEQLEAIENERRRQKRVVRAGAAAAAAAPTTWQGYPPPLPGQESLDPWYQKTAVPGQQPQSAQYMPTPDPRITQFSPSYAQQQQYPPYTPLPQQQGYAAEPIYMQSQPAQQQQQQQEPVMVAAAAGGRKRTLDATAAGDANISRTYIDLTGIADAEVAPGMNMNDQDGAPSPKRQRLGPTTTTTTTHSSYSPLLKPQPVVATTFGTDSAAAAAALDDALGADTAALEADLERFFDCDGDGDGPSVVDVDMDMQQHHNQPEVRDIPRINITFASPKAAEPLPTPTPTPTPASASPALVPAAAAEEGEMDVDVDFELDCCESLFGSSGGGDEDEDGGN